MERMKAWLKLSFLSLQMSIIFTVLSAQAEPTCSELNISTLSRTSGAEFLDPLMNLDSNSINQSKQRDQNVMQEIACGNIPRSFKERSAIHMRDDIIICVSNDFLSIGSNEDNIRMPLGQQNATRVMGHLGCMLPTTKMVEAIYASNNAKKIPMIGRWSERDPNITRGDDILGADQDSDRRIGNFSGLVSGHRKNIVFAPGTPAAGPQPSRVAIYGGWLSNGKRIQGRYLQANAHSHNAEYADYSHGLRCVSKTAFQKVNGKWVKIPLAELLTNPSTRNALNAGPTPTRSELEAYDTRISAKCPRRAQGSSGIKILEEGTY